MILGISKCAQSIPGIISDRPSWSRIIFENYFKSEIFSKEVERTFFQSQLMITKGSLIESVRTSEDYAKSTEIQRMFV